jgi:aflatoxin B1 aldehyde reductase
MVKIIVGTMGRSPFALTEALSTPQQFNDFFACCQKHNIVELDSARIYGGGESEQIMSSSLVDYKFEMSTKIGIGKLDRESIIQSANKSLADLKLDSVDILYIHRPSRDTPLQETCAAFNELYEQGKFKRFGICGYRADEVQEIYDVCKSQSFVLPTVYQGIFNPVTRRAEFDLFPTLRKLGIQFYAYGPSASGLLIKPVEQLLNAKADSRFGALPAITKGYLQDSLTKYVKIFQDVCKEEAVPTLDATFRYLLHHSALDKQDGFIIGASDVAQLDKNLEATKGGPLPQKVVRAFEDLWIGVEKEAAPYHN